IFWIKWLSACHIVAMNVSLETLRNGTATGLLNNLFNLGSSNDILQNASFGSSNDILQNASLTILNQTNSSSSWFSKDEVEHFLGDPDVLHAVALVLGTGAIVLGRRLPMMLAVVASVTLGLWVGLVIQDRQAYNNPLFGAIDLPEGQWVPLVAGFLAASAAAGLSYLTWKLALALLTGFLVALLAISACRLANVSPEKIFQLGASLLSAYRVVGAVVLTLAVLVSYVLVRKCHKVMASFASAQLGTLLLLSGVSHFSARVGNKAPFSLLDDLARIVAEVRGGRCQMWAEGEEEAGSGENATGGGDTGLLGCDCGDQCRTEISAWMLSSATVLAARGLSSYLRRRRAARLKDGEEETAPLAGSSSPAAQIVGSKSV
ncbi:unnamed protein product, partial [Polarella glacialis]